jgi:hypothetical protein
MTKHTISPTKVIDPTTNAAEMIGDPTGKPGITTDWIEKKRGTKQKANPDQNPDTVHTLPTEFEKRANDVATEPQQMDADRSKNVKIPMQRINSSTSQSEIHADPPNIQDEESFAGSAPDIEKIQQDDTVDRAHAVGLYDDYDENKDEIPPELDIAGEVNKDEEEHRYT